MKKSKYRNSSNIEYRQKESRKSKKQSSINEKNEILLRNNSKWIERLFHRDDDEIKRLREIKKKVKEIQTIEDLEKIEDELEELGILDKVKLDKLKQKKRKKRTDREIFYERIRCDLETINKVILVGKLYQSKERTKEEQELILNKDERRRDGGMKTKEKEKTKDREERTRSGGGRSRER